MQFGTAFAQREHGAQLGMTGFRPQLDLAMGGFCYTISPEPVLDAFQDHLRTIIMTRV